VKNIWSKKIALSIFALYFMEFLDAYRFYEGEGEFCLLPIQRWAN
jgi:hypothetical protein